MEPNLMQFKQLERNDLDWLRGQELNVKLELIKHHMTLCQLFLNEIFEEEVVKKAGPRYSHDKPNDGKYSRWGYNPGSVMIGDQRLKLDVPRIRDNEEGKSEPLDSYHRMREQEAPSEQLIKGVLLGLSMRDYEGVIDYLGEGFGLKKSSVSRSFVERTAETLEAYEQRSFTNDEFVCLFIDGKYLAKEQIIIVLGITNQGVKIPMGFIQAHTEHAQPIGDLLKNLVERGLKYHQGLLVVIDGSKGLKKAVQDVFGKMAVIQRCTWHKRENIKNYLKEEDYSWFLPEYHAAFDRLHYKDARADLERLARKLITVNRSAGNSLNEAIDELLTLHKLKINQLFWQSFSTTNIIENINAQLGKYLRKVKYWKNSEMRYRWVSAGLMEAEGRMRKINNYKKLPVMQKAILEYIGNPSRKSRISTKVGT